ncbi:sialic acid-binding Ig-like lectin 13 [Paramisgurnus dabryanus]|uniref:sialic acid-binding Ig-like lectin 13 n=1 Tax=Paramisgurnus dabryanus TaxID=90735 RepID=UPI0031F42F4C
MVVFLNRFFAFVLYLRASSASVDSWNAEIPKSVVGLSGSCVVIPCKFNYPDGKTDNEFTGIWYKDASDVIYHKETSKIISKFKDRTTLLGDLHHKNCTLKINSLQHNDAGPYMFRIEIKDFKYLYKDNKVSITVKDSPEQPIISVNDKVMSQKETTATCIVSHSCPSDPPQITWNHNGVPTSQSQSQDHGQWRLTSSLSFTPSREDHNKPLNCSANYSGGKKVTSSKTLKVRYPPEIKNESSCKLEPTVCVCIVDSNPPSEVKWLAPSTAFPSSSIEQNGFLTIFTLHGWLGFPDAVHCFASNSEGNSVITIQVRHHGMIIYIAVATAAVLVTLVIISVCVAKRHCRRRAQEQHLMDLKADPNEIPTTPKSVLNSKEEKSTYIYTNNKDDLNVYKNWECDDKDLPCGQDEDEAVYANT